MKNLKLMMLAMAAFGFVEMYGCRTSFVNRVINNSTNLYVLLPQGEGILMPGQTKDFSTRLQIGVNDPKGIILQRLACSNRGEINAKNFLVFTAKSDAGLQIRINDNLLPNDTGVQACNQYLTVTLNSDGTIKVSGVDGDNKGYVTNWTGRYQDQN